ncbi:MAG: hypothetical protein M3044_18395, partial [Thermoproteota archaeon]|nr:hypothetical protein [Thermoproteota archaeon]
MKYSVQGRRKKIEAIQRKEMSNTRILMVDDDTDVNTTLRTVLEANGFNVDSYEDPLLALSNFKIRFYDLVIL